MAVFMLKQVVEYYVSLSSPVYICYLDASKAFDKVNHWILFDKLLTSNVPPIIVRILMIWYTSQLFMIKWNDVLSIPFSVSNGVRQGGILSPILFNVYVDELSLKLSASQVGCNINNASLNHFIYADDTVLLTPSPSAMQKLLKLCSEFAVNHDIVYNTKKTVIMCIKPKCFNHIAVPNFYLNGRVIKLVTTQKYLGVLINAKFDDNDDLHRQLKCIYSRGNMIIKRFSECNEEIKSQLFKSYCSNFYCCQLWSERHFHVSSIKRVRVAFKRIFKSLFKLKRESITAKMVQLNCDTFDEIRRKLVYSFKVRLENSSNLLVKTIIESMFFQGSSLNSYWTKQLYNF
jgi:hypothetical protein